MKLMHVTREDVARAARAVSRSLNERRLAALVLLVVFLGGPFAAAQDELYQQTRAFRERLLADMYRPGYHFVTLEGLCSPFDPNGAIFWKGRYHMFYIFQDHRGHNFGHASSIDLVHWRHHTTGLAGGMFSGNCFINKEGVPTMCYHGQQQKGNRMAVALDDELNEWKKLAVITPKTAEGDAHHGTYRSWDPFGWLEGDTYYAIFGGKRPAIAKCDSLEGQWKYVGDLLAHSVGDVDINEDISCADLFKMGDKYVLLCISHRLGCRYYIGQWKNEQFYPEYHEQMSWADNEYFAPESLLDDKGRRIMWAWMFDRRSKKLRNPSGWSGTMGLPRVLAMNEDGSALKMWPPKELELLRYNPKIVDDFTVAADGERRLKKVSGNSIELFIEMVPKGAEQFGIKVCVSPDSAEQTLIYYDATRKKLMVDTTNSSLNEGKKAIEGGPFELKADETLTLRVFVDKSVVEVFANDRQAVARRIFPSRKDSTGVVLFSKGGSAKVMVLKAWDMMPSNPY
ncbi:MAG: glycoside hydrolase family 32 protein [Planctomycetota bacterium]|jgi:beta-fructofuranosidase